jgi:energy-coupling factor transporter ATP-binding protein EcfA2
MVVASNRTNPFPGLRPFELDEEHLFFGREGQSDELMRRLNRTHFLGVVGTSGSGKSSLVRAGLLPSLYSGFLPEASSSWRIAILRPGNAPIRNLAEALNAPDVFGVESTRDEAIIRLALTESTLRRGSLGLIEVTEQARMDADETLLLVVDQFEELFRFKAQAQATGNRLAAEDEAAAFVKLLLAAVHQREVPIFGVLTMRSDFLGDCAQFRDLPETLNDSQYLIPRLTREQLRQAIEGPVAVGGATITPRLVNRLLNDTGDNPDQLPIVQHALMRTWDYWEDQHTPEVPLDLEHYAAIGGMAQALSRHADQIYEGLPDERSRQLAETLFRCLTDRGADNREIRRPTPLAEICAVANAAPEAIIAVIDEFRGPRRSFLMPPPSVPLHETTVLDISHESLMRNWERLKGWVAKEAQSATIYRRLAETAELHEQGKAGYLREPELTIALTWQKEQHPNRLWAERYAPNFEEAMAFLAASAQAAEEEATEKERARKREVNRLRGFLVVLGGLSLLTGGAAVYAFNQQQEAQEQTQIAFFKAESFRVENLMASGLNFKALLAALDLNLQIKEYGAVQEPLPPVAQAKALGQDLGQQVIPTNIASEPDESK